MKLSVAHALLAALLFGASTPFAKLLLGDLSPILLAGLLYLGSGLGLGAVRIARDKGWRNPELSATEARWLAAAIVFGGVLGPIALLFGLTHSSASVASLLLNLEAVLTAVLAWVVFKESADKRLMFGMAAIVAGGIVLAWPGGELSVSEWLGPLSIAGACLCWAIDNNLTRKVSTSDAMFIAGSKGLLAGTFNLLLALAIGDHLPVLSSGLSAMLLGFIGYGCSLALFVLALRGLGSARAGAYFSTAPFIGAAIAVFVLGETTTPLFWLAAALMAIGVWLHLSERHSHEHTHEALEHSHRHVHDEHHQHEHESWDGQEPHTHSHRHLPLKHSHAHFPDVHHRHKH